METITEGLFAAANRLCKSISPRIEELKKRYEKAGQVANLVTNLKSFPSEEAAGSGIEKEEAHIRVTKR